MRAPELGELTAFPGVAVDEVDGVPVLLAPREGNMSGGIVFRVGSAHETLATSGITHLVEHLALREQVLSEAHLNGQTHAGVTLFHVTGSASDVVGYLNDVCAALRDLPLDRIETEKDILRSEAGARSPGFTGRLRLNRHGARGLGLVRNGERGLDRLTADEVRDWAATWFTRGNAVAWFTGDALPDGLDLRLPEGSHMPAPPLTDVLGATPAYLTGLRDGVALDAILPRGDAASVTALVLREVLHRDLRADADLAGSVDVTYEGLDDEHARIDVAVQAVEGRQDAVVGGVLDALGGLRYHVADADLAAARALAAEDLAAFAAAPAADHLPGLAFQMVTGRPLKSADEMRAAVDRVTADDVRAMTRRLWDGALWFAPEPLDRVGVVEAPRWSAQPAVGRAFPRIDAPDVSVVLASDGVGHVAPDGGVTVRFADCVLLEVWPDGARALTGTDGFRVVVEPTLYDGLTAVDVAWHVDAHVPADVVVQMPERAAGDIPVPTPAPAPARRRRRTTTRRAPDPAEVELELPSVEEPRSVPATVGLVVALWVGGLLLLGGGQLLLERALDTELRLGILPVLALVWATFGLINRRHPRQKR
ncbi:hypothetical protein ACO229_05330 [Promicromonospora sp. MS192]|uniref:hypothetical protein n=1 Tax=Promicromonospora sp. MS192 TaxID=3412684 RepID=UPI003C2E8CE7